MNATGYVSTEFRKAFEFGHVFNLDEIDHANPNVLGVLNSALANKQMAFPDGMVTRHDNFIVVASGNTFGTGATAQYVGANPIDAATKDRFAVMEIHYDEAIEDAMVASVGLDKAVATKWLFTNMEVLEQAILKGTKPDQTAKVLEGVSF
jgi:cobaltochelatase CobS